VDESPLVEAEGLAPEHLLEALWAEQRRRWARGEDTPARVYLQRYPAVAADPERAADLIYHEFVVREEFGGAPPFADYLRDYAPYAPQLEALQAADRVLQTRPPKGRLGDYELLEEVGRGGMGVVYKARQVSLNRIVAVKRLLAGSWASSDELERFRREAEAAARLQHPNIVAVHEVGEDAGQPYFSMDFVDGRSLAALVRENLLPATQAAGYVRDLAEAVHYAHGQGLLHRDLKPANVLIDRHCRPRITDFGLAKQLAGGEHLTATGQVLGTPGYVSPEQAAGKPDRVGPASDIYGLGATLYELLTGRPPFRAETPFDTLLQVIGTEPAVPRLLNPKVPRDLETICLKRLQKEPTKRYASAQDLADDLGRFLGGKPIRARPVGALGRVMRWGMRRPGVAGLAAAVVLVAVGGFAGVVWQWRQAEAARRAEAAAKEKAEGNFDQLARTHLRLAEITQEVRPTAEAIHLYQHTLSLFDQLARERPAAGDHQLNAAQAYRKLGSLYRDTSQLKEAETAFHTGLRAVERLLQDAPDDARLREVKAQTLADLGRLYRAMDKVDKAGDFLRQASDIYAKLVQEQPGSTDYRQGLAVVHNNLGVLQRWKREQALSSLQRALEIQDQLVRDDPANPSHRNDLANTRYNLGNYWLHTGGRLDKAEEAYLLALRLRQELASKYPTVHYYQHALAKCMGSLAVIYQATGRPGEAVTAYRDAMSVLERLVQDNPTLSEYALTLAVTATKLADLGSEPAQAQVALYTQAVSHLEGILKRDEQHAYARQFLRGSLERRARALTEVGRHAEAIQDWDRTLESAATAERDAVRLGRAATLAYLGDHVGAAAEANELAGKSPAAGDVLYQAACVYALSSVAAAKDAQLPAAEREKLAERHASRALALLTQAHAAGYFKDPAHHGQLRNDKELSSLRSREGFQHLLR
jgi:tetratricopeptide (TPR) repeat protein